MFVISLLLTACTLLLFIYYLCSAIRSVDSDVNRTWNHFISVFSLLNITFLISHTNGVFHEFSTNQKSIRIDCLSVSYWLV